MANRNARLTEKQRRAIEAYLTNGNKIGEALRTAGYSEQTVRQSSTAWFAPRLQEELERRRQEVAKNAKLTPEWVLERLMERADAGRILAEFKRIDEDGQLYWDFTGADKKALALVSAIGVEFIKSGRGKGSIDITKTKVQEPDIGGAIRDLMRHLGMFNDKLEVTGSMADRIREARDYARRAGEPEQSAETVH